MTETPSPVQSTVPEADDASVTVLYASYNGIDEPLVRSQVLNYIEALAREGYRFELLTFERAAMSEAQAGVLRAALHARGIRWRWIAASRMPAPLSTLADVLRGVAQVRSMLRRRRARLFHARSFIPALIGRCARWRYGIPLLNDIRGFWIDEKVYKGSLRSDGMVYRLGKRLEAWVLTGSDAIVSLSDAGQAALRDFSCFRRTPPPPMTTIPTCVDLQQHALRVGAAPRPLVAGYVGSMSEDYLPDQLGRFFLALRRRYPDARLHVVTRSDPQRVTAVLREVGVPPECVSILRATPEDVPAQIRSFGLALSLIRPGFAKLASCPTKVGEYLAAGIPVVSNRGIGDLDALIGDNAVGWILEELTEREMDRVVAMLPGVLDDPALAARCRRVAEQQFSLELGVARYAATYRSLLQQD